MRRIAKYWKALLALVLIAVSVPLFLKIVQRRDDYQMQLNSLSMQIASYQAAIQPNLVYADVQDKLEGELAAIAESRKELYSHFPSKLLEEDQIRYILYLEETFKEDVTFALSKQGVDIQFSFSQTVPMAALNDGSYLCGVTLGICFETTYEEFKDMTAYLSADERITSVRYARLNYDEENDTVWGGVVVTLYTISSEPYVPPEATEHTTGKITIFEEIGNEKSAEKE